ncbi:MFS general substrate transporter, partial [Polychaeton citri CBS 116435]
VEELTSASTTLVGSARSTGEHSLDLKNGDKYAEAEFKVWDRQQNRRWHERGEGQDLQRQDSSDSDTLTSAHEDEAASTLVAGVSQEATTKDKPVSWSQLPRKDQLAILTLARLSEPLAATSLQAYMFYMLKSFETVSGEPPSDATVASQTGMLAAAFTGAQFATAIIWGRLADSQFMGRKRVILIGLLGSCISTLGFGFCKTFPAAVLWRIFGGLLNGNIGVMRTMISETIREKKFQSRAFLLLPMCFNIGCIIGPLMGGLLADPAGSYPALFGKIAWMKEWPYALPNIVTATFLALSILGVFFGLEETLEGRNHSPDWGLKVGRAVGRGLRNFLLCGRIKPQYAALNDYGDVELRTSLPGSAEATKKKKKRSYTGKHRLPFKRMWTRNVCFTLLAHFILAMHIGTFNVIWFVFLSTPRYDPATASGTSANTTTDGRALQLPPDYNPHAPFTFTGGLAFPPPTIGTALAILGVVGLFLQLSLFPRLSFKWGTERSLRGALILPPIAYMIAPYLSVLPSTSSPPNHASGFLVWLGIIVVLLIQVTARTFALPAMQILVNNACPHPSVLGTLHGFGQSTSSGARTLGPLLAGWIYGIGLEKGVVGLAWWCMASVAIVGAVAGRWVKEGDGREIWLEGE